MNMAAATAVEDNPLIYLPHHKFYSDDKLRRILSSVRTFAMVGASTNWKRPSFYAMKYLTGTIGQHFNIITTPHSLLISGEHSGITIDEIDIDTVGGVDGVDRCVGGRSP